MKYFEVKKRLFNDDNRLESAGGKICPTIQGLLIERYTEFMLYHGTLCTARNVSEVRVEEKEQ